MVTLEDTFLEDLEVANDLCKRSNKKKKQKVNKTIGIAIKNDGSDKDDAVLDVSMHDTGTEKKSGKTNEGKSNENDNDKTMHPQTAPAASAVTATITSEGDMFIDMEPLIDIDLFECSNEEPLMLTMGASVETVSDLLNDPRLNNHLRVIEKLLGQEEQGDVDFYQNQESDYDLIVTSNQLALEVDNHILRVHKFLKDIYATKFPELEEMVIHPIEYAKCVKMISNKSGDVCLSLCFVFGQVDQ
ncbi:hypothetical protein RFI_20872 [Reticulomyxa filosa]|uniref:NOSIC domain-containing protein n=1 Tax=Reticulomyxa filosa TaxID=46433 RepID=X6MRP1_RETFI|nr:hypothetical protein RFI_20872 [Reticulomyxa filosa]|eukprot:ETO16469.1 hypothetical protein RFI_20872 [Reticulomyxa filosa]